MYYNLMKGNGSETGRKSIGVLTLVMNDIFPATEDQGNPTDR